LHCSKVTTTTTTAAAAAAVETTMTAIIIYLLQLNFHTVAVADTSTDETYKNKYP